MKRNLFLTVVLITLVLAVTACSEGQTNEEVSSRGEIEEISYKTVTSFGCSYSVPENWENCGWEETDYYPFEYEKDGEEYEEGIEVGVIIQPEDINWESYCEDYLYDGVTTYKNLEKNGVEVLYVEDHDDMDGYIHEYIFNADNKGEIIVRYYSNTEDPEYLEEFEKLADSMDVSGVAKYIDGQREEYSELMEENADLSDEESEENSSIGNEISEPQEESTGNLALEEKYLETIRDIYENNVDIRGKGITHYSESEDDERKNQFAIYDVDHDGKLELIISYNKCNMEDIWGGIFQFDFESDSYKEELWRDEAVIYDNGIVLTEANHNHTDGAMWPFTLYMYNEERDIYDFLCNAYSWDKSKKTEGFPEEVDTDAVGTVYFVTEEDGGYGEDTPISQTEFNDIIGQYISGVGVVNYPLFTISEQGIVEYQEAK